MPSSTSNSDPAHRAPEAPWRRIWATALAFAVLVLAGGELGARAIGLEPMVQDDARLWSYWRAKVDASAERRQVVMVGTSRVQLGMDPAVLNEGLGPDYEVIDLATNGGSPLPALHHLANDPEFRGVAVVGLHPRAFFGHKDNWEAKTRGFVSSYESRGFSDDFEARMRFFFQERFAILLPQFIPTTFAGIVLQTGALPRPPYIHTRLDRYLGADYSKAPNRVMDKEVSFTEAVRPPEEMASLTKKLARDIAQIEERGGRVVFVRMPSSGPTAAAEEQWCPRASCYEALKRDLTNADFFHFADDPELQAFTCADGGHLDVRDVPRFTERFATLLRELLAP